MIQTGYPKPLCISLTSWKGFQWVDTDGTHVDGEYYVGIGTLGENNPAGEGFKLDVTIELNLSASGYVLTLLFGAIGVQLIRND